MTKQAATDKPKNAQHSAPGNGASAHGRRLKLICYTSHSQRGGKRRYGIIEIEKVFGVGGARHRTFRAGAGCFGNPGRLLRPCGDCHVGRLSGHGPVAGFREELHASSLRRAAQLCRSGRHGQGDLRWRDPRHAPRPRPALEFLRPQAVRALPRRARGEILRRWHDRRAASKSDRGASSVREFASIQGRHSPRRRDSESRRQELHGPHHQSGGGHAQGCQGHARSHLIGTRGLGQADRSDRRARRNSPPLAWNIPKW